MAEFRLGPLDDEDSETDEFKDGNVGIDDLPPIKLSRFDGRRHYKKDSRYLLDLYTLTFDDGQTLEKIQTTKTVIRRSESSGADFVSLAPDIMMSSNTIDSHSSSSGPVSLQFNNNNNSTKIGLGSLPYLETNLHKILARKIQDSEDVSFQKTKLLTKAYYNLLKDSSVTIPTKTSSDITPAHVNTEHVNIRIPWQTLVTSNVQELRRIVNGLGNSATALNEYLVDILIERDELVAEQDNMLEDLTELTDRLL